MSKSKAKSISARGPKPLLGDLDKSILAELTADPFASNAAVASALGIAPSLVTSRMRILERNEVSQILAVLDLDRMNQSFCIVQIGVSGRAVADVADDLAGLRRALMVSELADDDADLLLLLRFEDLRVLKETLHHDIAKISGVKRWEVNIVLDVPIFGTEYVSYSSHYSPINIEQNLEFLKDDIPAGICDETDLLIIAHLQENAHQSINDIARRLDMKPSTTRYRINNLKNSGILRFIRVIDHISLGYDTFTLLEMGVDADRVGQVIEALRGQSWLPQMFRCVGNADLVGILPTSGAEEVLRIKREVLRPLDGVSSIRLIPLQRTFKNDLRWAQRST